MTNKPSAALVRDSTQAASSSAGLLDRKSLEDTLPGHPYSRSAAAMTIHDL